MLRWVVVLVAPLFAASYLLADWWVGLPEQSEATYVGRQTCAQCHQNQMDQWHGSHHDLAMDLATPDTVLGDFNDATLEHYGITSRMFRDGDKYMVNTEGPDGAMTDFEVKYVFGVEPLQQYMVEMNRPNDLPEHEISRVQVLRITWDTENKKWFYLSPPDVDEKLEPDDPLHWTGTAQNWNHMCADCHSTNLQKNYDIQTRTYHTTFSEIDVSCETCHGPGSLHVKLANAKSPFWDRKLGYGLKRLKVTDNKPEIESCAPCHSRRRMVHQGDDLRDGYYDCFHNGLIRPETYHADGQILDEVYVYGSFIQSKMYHKGIRCTDCHDPHTTKLKHEGNAVCVSCHTHTPAKYDTSGHHHHPPGSAGTQCVACHMPATPYMDIDLRRDHSLRVPRPDLSVELNTPNACTGCHLDKERISPEKREELQHYSQWLAAARAGDQEVQAELDRVNRWAAQRVDMWYGKKERPHFARGLSAAWNRAEDAIPKLLEIAQSRDYPAIARASALEQLQQLGNPNAESVARRALSHQDPQMRAAAVAYLEILPIDEPSMRRVAKVISPLLNDSERLVRTEAARVLAGFRPAFIDAEYHDPLRAALEEYRTGLLLNSDQAGAHMSLALLAERMGKLSEAVAAYRTAIHVQPDVSGPRSNLAALLENTGDTKGAQELRVAELKLLERDARLAPDFGAIQYRYGLALYLNGQLEEAVARLERACELEPELGDFRMALTLLYERLQRWDDALESLKLLREMQPHARSLDELEARIRSQAR